MKKNKIQRAFTLIELLVVISIIGILIALGVASYTTAQRKARDAKRKADLEIARQAMILRRQDHPSYGNAGLNFTTYFNTLYPDYIVTQNLVDPKNESPYVYELTCITADNPHCTRAALTAYLENNDPNNPETYEIITP